MKKIKEILKFKVMVFPDNTYFDVKDVIIGGLILLVLVLIS